VCQKPERFLSKQKQVRWMEKNQKNGKNRLEVEELMKYPQLVERELEYWIKEKRVSCIEKAIKANDVNTRFAGTYSLDTIDYLHPSDDDMIDIMYEEHEELVDNIAEAMEQEKQEEHEEEFAEAG
jgi:hypothetical protein